MTYKVFFTCSTREIEKKVDDYKKIVNTISTIHGTKIIRNWLEEALERKRNGRTTDDEIVGIYEEVNGAIAACDMMIVEGTVSSMSVGYQIVLATQMKKPVLFLQVSDSKQDNFVIGLNSPFIWSRTYNEKNIGGLIKSFIKNFSESKNLRFNLVLNKEQINYISWKSTKSRFSKTKVIKEIINGASLKDKEYKIFLNRKEGF